MPHMTRIDWIKSMRFHKLRLDRRREAASSFVIDTPG
jgi:hypothetical protein